MMAAGGRGRCLPSLAAVWQKLFDELATGATVSPDEDPVLAGEITKYSQPNSIARLRSTAASASIASNTAAAAVAVKSTLR